ncbi:C-terminal helicase domain-containing protein [Solirubrobacter soli]|uniref:C-terminal helicase domain-containing protein n=1 Tax=Solirubrobacter soli TaxID=363832 RepID=UPI0004007FEC|nr:C-terminal helicase domain-containing protein [Solirubrobacter soli]
MRWRLSGAVHLEGGGIQPADAERQRRTAVEILRRFDELPGVVLADEVGMGKTFVALAVAVSVIEATGGHSPVVVMVPPSVRGKWPKEWRKLAARLDTDMEIRAAEESVTSASEFLKLLDDPPDRRKHLIFLTHGALHNALNDPLLKLAIVRQALLSPRLKAQRQAFPRWAGRIIPGLRYSEATCRALIETPVSRWRRVLRLIGADPGDDPVPTSVLDALPRADLGTLREIIESQLPLRSSQSLEHRLKMMRSATTTEVTAIWKRCLAELDLDLPLLILDEAHHAKNPATRLAGLFANQEAREEVEALRGGLGGVFDRMLFLTATPFQLGHEELIEVLRRFIGVRWNDLDRAAYEARLEELRRALDDMQAAALRLDRAWGRLTPEDVSAARRSRWWADSGEHAPDSVRAVAATWSEVRERAGAAATALRPLVVRHVRPDRDARRELWCGRSIVSGNVSDSGGLGVDGAAVLPFLLAARAQAIVAASGLRDHRAVRALFADGLASSFEAYRRTRLPATAGEDLDDAVAGMHIELPASTQWYLDRIAQALPDEDRAALGSHPKVAATVHRALALWRAREKALIFCFYKATGRALRLHIARGIEAEIVRLGAESLRIDARRDTDVLGELDTVRERLFRPGSPARRYVERELLTVLKSALSGDELTRAADLSLRFLRTRSFLVRYTDLSAEPRAAMELAFERRDASGRGLRELVGAFGAFIARREESERARYLDALESIGVGEISVRDDEGEREGLIANVRLANGDVAHEQRERLMIAFNTPFFPEVLVASSVMAEGVDLHLNCRHVIHHDLDWNPSVIEQRTGRLDRIDSKGEVTGLPILVYEPYVEGAQDEKQFRVMKDRERWFNVVMGDQLELDELHTDRLADRVPLPPDAAAELVMDLAVVPLSGKPSRAGSN